ncbi:22570_t:CDS:2, partial [Dentiscutata erythropus]
SVSVRFIGTLYVVVNINVTNHDSSNDESLTSIVDKNITSHDSKSCHCGVCGQVDHNSRTYSMDRLNNHGNNDVESATSI